VLRRWGQVVVPWRKLTEHNNFIDLTGSCWGFAKQSRTQQLEPASTDQQPQEPADQVVGGPVERRERISREIGAAEEIIERYTAEISSVLAAVEQALALCADAPLALRQCPTEVKRQLNRSRRGALSARAARPRCARRSE